jgi:hypothetical protein
MTDDKLADVLSDFVDKIRGHSRNERTTIRAISGG